MKLAIRTTLVILFVIAIPHVFITYPYEQTAVFPSTTHTTIHTQKGYVIAARYSKLEVTISGENYTLDTEIWYFSSLINTKKLLFVTNYTHCSEISTIDMRIPNQGSLWVYIKVHKADSEVKVKLKETGVNYNQQNFQIVGLIVIIGIWSIYCLSVIRKRYKSKI